MNCCDFCRKRGEGEHICSCGCHLDRSTGELRVKNFHCSEHGYIKPVPKCPESHTEKEISSKDWGTFDQVVTELVVRAHVQDKHLHQEGLDKILSAAKDLIRGEIARAKQEKTSEILALIEKFLKENEEESHTFEECKEIHIGRSEALSDTLHTIREL